MVSATVSDEERQAIADFLAHKPITKCPDGEASGAHISWHIQHYETWLSEQGLSVVPERDKPQKPGSLYSMGVRAGTRGDLVDQISDSLKDVA